MARRKDGRGTLIDMEEFGRLLKAERIRAGIGRASDLTAAMRVIGYNVDTNTLYRIERGEVSIQFETLIAIATILPRMMDMHYLRPALRGAAANAPYYAMVNLDSREIQRWADSSPE